MRNIKHFIFALFLSFTPAALWAQESEPSEEQIQAQIKELENSLKWQTGNITLRNGLARFQTPKGFRYLNHENAVKVLNAWGNEDVGDTLGMVFPDNLSVFHEDSWGIVITYQDDGHVQDGDAKSIDYAKLLKDMQDSIAEENKERKKHQAPQVELIGWATPPKYDERQKKMFWAKELRFEGNEKNTLNYNVRILGRTGVLVLNVVSRMDQLKLIESHMPSLLASVDFMPGYTYADYKPGEDKKADYGLTGLIAGGLALGAAGKAGLFKVILTGLLAMKKLLIVLVIAGVGLLRKFWTSKKTPTA